MKKGGSCWGVEVIRSLGYVSQWSAIIAQTKTRTVYVIRSEIRPTGRLVSTMEMTLCPLMRHWILSQNVTLTDKLHAAVTSLLL